MTPFELLERVVDKATFLEFSWAMVEEAAQAEQLAREQPEKYKYDDPLGWAHLQVSEVLGQLTVRIEEHPDDQPFTWKDAAEYLWCAKIIE
jgi:hypothetical protein